ncbi:MAG: mitochondrial thiamine pyrophosphate transporter [Peltula sp. TS41687]|nr:MAG: mitochondrial thiamine pyrophosphate transporter [Peltula sp. TS41687]
MRWVDTNSALYAFSQAHIFALQGSKKQVVIAGAAAGPTSFCIAPLDVIKIRLQLQVRSTLSNHPSSPDGVGPGYRGAVQLARTIVCDEGIRALWKGNIPAELLYLLYGGAQFSMYRSVSSILQTHVPNLPNAASSLISGALAGAVATTATYPLDLLRTRFAAQGNDRVYASLLASVRDIYRHEGARGYFQGLGAGVGQIVPYMGLFFATYEALRPPLASVRDLLPIGVADATAGVLAGVLAKTGVFPLDVVRKRLQVQGPTRARYVWGGAVPVYEGGVGGTLRCILRQEGVRGLYRGLGVGLVKAAPASAVTMWSYERVLRGLMEWEGRGEEGGKAGHHGNG